MSLGLQILIGAVCGFVFGFFAIMGAINTKEKELGAAWAALVEALNIRYLKLKNVLNFLNKHMGEFSSEIMDVIGLCDEAIESDSSIKEVINKLKAENNINYKLQEIKTNMTNYPSLQNDPEVDSAILAIAESEAVVGEAIRSYNGANLEYTVFLETFPISVVAWILNKTPEAVPFNVSQVQEFDDNYLDEDEI